MANTGNGSTITFSSTATVFSVKEIDMGEQTIEDIEDSDLSTEDFKTYISSDLAEPNEMSIVVNWDTTDALPSLGVQETITVTAKLATGETAAANLVGTGYFKGIKFPTLVNDTLQEGTLTLKLDGKTGPTYTPATTGP